MIQVSHESPINMLKNKSREYNDYDYALVHLFEDNPEYFNYFKQSLRDGRKVYLDNSIFELGVSFDPIKYQEWIYELQPTYYIIPDVLENATGTIRQLFEWKDMLHGGYQDPDDGKAHEGYSQPDEKQQQVNIKLESISKIKTIGVVQGRDWHDLVECYQVMSKMVDMIAISFDYSYYLHTGVGLNNNTNWYDVMSGELTLPEDEDTMNCTACQDKLNRYSTGRQRFIQQLIDEGVWDWSKPHHLLGCSLAKEFKYYTNSKTKVDNIVSIDTSNPIVAGLKRLRYNHEEGLDGKPNTLLADMINFNVSDDEWIGLNEHIDFNTSMFKRIINRY